MEPVTIRGTLVQLGILLLERAAILLLMDIPACAASVGSACRGLLALVYALPSSVLVEHGVDSARAEEAARLTSSPQAPDVPEATFAKEQRYRRAA